MVRLKTQNDLKIALRQNKWGADDPDQQFYENYAAEPRAIGHPRELGASQKSSCSLPGCGHAPAPAKGALGSKRGEPTMGRGTAE
jgi:hypothetical protein